VILYVAVHLAFYCLFLPDLLSQPFWAMVEGAAFLIATALLYRVKTLDPGYVGQNLELPQFRQKESADSRICETCQVFDLFSPACEHQHRDKINTHRPDYTASEIQALSSLQPMCGSV